MVVHIYASCSFLYYIIKFANTHICNYNDTHMIACCSMLHSSRPFKTVLVLLLVVDINTYNKIHHHISIVILTTSKKKKKIHSRNFLEYSAHLSLFSHDTHLRHKKRSPVLPYVMSSFFPRDSVSFFFILSSQINCQVWTGLNTKFESVE